MFVFKTKMCGSSLFCNICITDHIQMALLSQRSDANVDASNQFSFYVSAITLASGN